MEEKNEKELLADLYNKVNNIEQLLKQILSIHYPPYSSDDDKPEPTAEDLANENKLKFEMLYDNDIDFEEYDIESELKKFAESNNEVIDMTFDELLEDQKQQESTEESTEESSSTQ